MSSTENPQPAGDAPALDVRDLEVTFHRRGRRLPVLEGRHAQDRAWRGLRSRRRVGLRQDHPRHGCHALPRRQRHARQRSRAGRRAGCQRAERGGPPQVAWRQGGHGLPGPDAGAEPGHEDRRSAGRGLPLSRGAGQEGGLGEGAGGSAPRGHAGPGRDPAPLSVRTVGRAAAEGRHRDGARRQPAVAHPRRAHHRPRRHRGG